MSGIERNEWMDISKAFTEEQWKIVLENAPRNLLINEMNERLHTSELLIEHCEKFKEVCERANR